MLNEKDFNTTDNFPLQLSSSLFKMQQENLFCDIILMTESTSISCHRIVLAATSQYFKNKLLHNQDDIIYLPSWFTGNGLELIVFFLYTGTIDKRFSNISLFCKIVIYLGIEINLQNYIPLEYFSLILKNEKSTLNDIKLEEIFVPISESNLSSLDKTDEKRKLIRTRKRDSYKKKNLSDNKSNKIIENLKKRNKKYSLTKYLSYGEIYSCNLCNKSFKYNIGLSYHKKKNHKLKYRNKLHLHTIFKPLLLIKNYKYKCKICNYSSKYKSICTSHIIKHLKFKSHTSKSNCKKTKNEISLKLKNRKVESNLFLCEHCKQKFINISKLDEHLMNIHGIITFNCELCAFSTNYPEILRKHDKNKHNKVNSCLLCGKNFNVFKQLTIHQYLIHGIKDEALQKMIKKCQIKDCNYECISNKRFNDHSLKHSDQKLFSCKMCEKQFKHKKGLEKHKQIIHDRIRPFICEICGLCFGKDSELRFHLIRHSKEKRFKCEKCAYSTHDKCNLQSHMFRRHKIMSNPRMIVLNCNCCPFITNCKGNFRDHMKKHTNVLDVPCSECGKLFATKKNLYGHITKVHRPKSLHCSFCTYSTSLRTTLRDHIRIMHEQRNVKPFECPFCGFRSATRGNCRKHIQRLHNEYSTEPLTVVQQQNDNNGRS